MTNDHTESETTDATEGCILCGSKRITKFDRETYVRYFCHNCGYCGMIK